MDAYGTGRLAAKDAESAIVARICEDFNLTPVLGRAHYEQMARYFSEFGHMALRPGELCYLAVAADEPAGKPIVACRKVQVALELAAPEDQRALTAKGLAVMRQGRLARNRVQHLPKLGRLGGNGVELALGLLQARPAATEQCHDVFALLVLGHNLPGQGALALVMVCSVGKAFA